MNKESIRSHLRTHCLGRKRAASSLSLETTLEISGNKLRKQVNALRREGVPIASSGEGYFYAETAAEVYGTIRSLQKMRRGLDAAIAGLEQALGSFGESS